MIGLENKTPAKENGATAVGKQEDSALMSPWGNSADYNFVNYFTPLHELL